MHAFQKVSTSPLSRFEWVREIAGIAPNEYQAQIKSALDAGIDRFEKKKIGLSSYNSASLPEDLRAAKGAVEEELKQEICRKAALALDLIASGEHRLIVEAQTALALCPLKEAAKRLELAGFPKLARELIELFPRVLPFIVQGYDESPVHHVAHVVNFASGIGIGEKLNKIRLRQVVIAALFHDCGVGPAVLPKIRESQVALASPERQDGLRQWGIRSRREHMILGEQIVQTHFGHNRTICAIVGEHDNCKIPLLEPNREKHREWLLKPKDAFSDILQCHWEADAAWMLEYDGLVVDLASRSKLNTIQIESSAVNTPANRIWQFGYNISLHREVVDLYRQAFGPQSFLDFGFPAQGWLYRTKSGCALAAQKQNELLNSDGRRFLAQLGTSLSGEPIAALIKCSFSETATDERYASIALLGLLGNPSGEYVPALTRLAENKSDSKLSTTAKAALWNLGAFA